jgi:hypothetical protein
MVVVMTIAIRRAFDRRTIVELREEDERTFFSVTESGRPAVADVRLEYPGDERRCEAAGDEIPAFPSLRRVSFRFERGSGALKVWAHRITPEGNSEGLAGLLRVSQGDETRQFDLKLSKGLVVLPIVPGACQVDITFSGAGSAGSVDGLL